MEFLNNAAVLWFIAGFVFFILEFLIPGLILFFFAIGAWIVAILLLFFPLSINMQLIIFIASAVITTLFLRKFVKNIIWSPQNPTQLEDEFIGKYCVAATPIEPGKDGKVEFKGTSWNARSDDFIAAGQQVIITGNESILLIVKSTQTIS